MSVLSNYLKIFDLKPSEVALKILICTKDKVDTELNNIQIADLKTLPKLPYSDQSYGLALCSQILFLDDADYSENFYVEFLVELCRVGNEARVWPVVNNHGQPSRYLGPVLKILQEKSFGVELRQVNDDAHPGEALLRVWNPACKV
jgi:hypothetical protein